MGPSLKSDTLQCETADQASLSLQPSYSRHYTHLECAQGAGGPYNYS